MATPFRIAYITFPNTRDAVRIGRVLIGRKLAACCNIIPSVRSFYRFGGKLHDDREVLLLAKTHRSQVEELTACVRLLHSYECPCIVMLPLLAGNLAYLRWLERQLETVGRGASRGRGRRAASRRAR